MEQEVTEETEAEDWLSVLSVPSCKNDRTLMRFLCLLWPSSEDPPH